MLIKLDPAVLTSNSEANPTATQKLISEGVAHGLRASLKTGSLLTGQLFVELEEFEGVPAGTGERGRLED